MLVSLLYLFQHLQRDRLTVAPGVGSYSHGCLTSMPLKRLRRILGLRRPKLLHKEPQTFRQRPGWIIRIETYNSCKDLGRCSRIPNLSPCSLSPGSDLRDPATKVAAKGSAAVGRDAPRASLQATAEMPSEGGVFPRVSSDDVERCDLQKPDMLHVFARSIHPRRLTCLLSPCAGVKKAAAKSSSQAPAPVPRLTHDERPEAQLVRNPKGSSLQEARSPVHTHALRTGLIPHSTPPEL